MRIILITLTLLALSGAGQVMANDCSKHQDAYEAGVNDGRHDGSRGASQDPGQHHKDYGNHKNRYKCYKQGYKIGYGNAAADAKKVSAQDADMPRQGSNEREYYDDGCHEGKSDAKMSMSMVYERHSDMYDSRFEPYFQQGYEACWKKNR